MYMGDFDEFIKPSVVEVTEAPKAKTTTASEASGESKKTGAKSKQSKGKSITELLMGEDQNASVFADRLGLDTEMTEKVLFHY